jgi:hypothetical protein
VRLVMALMLFVVAAFLLALAFGLHSPGPGEVRTPPVMIGMGVLVFAVAGVALLFHDRPAVGWAAAMVILACAGLAGLWIGLFADPAEIGGGVPFISAEANTRVGRTAFTLGGLLCLVLLAWGVWLGPRRQRRD